MSDGLAIESLLQSNKQVIEACRLYDRPRDNVQSPLMQFGNKIVCPFFLHDTLELLLEPEQAWRDGK